MIRLKFLGLIYPTRLRGRCFRAFKKEMEQSYGILCFCRTKRNPVLWSHYADKHKGMCLGFDVRDDSLNAVKYVSRRLVFKSTKDMTEGKGLRVAQH